MKMKKIVLLFSMIAVLFSLTACSNNQNEAEFSYDETDIVGSSVMMVYQFLNIDDANRAYYEATEEEADQVIKTGLSNFDVAKNECGAFKGYRSIENDGVVNIDLSSSQLTTEGFIEMVDQIDSNVKETDGSVEVTLQAVYDERDVEIRFVYSANPAYAYTEGASPYKVSEITVIPKYTLGEKMAKAGQNTLMGMGTVFVVLIFISLIIAQFERVNKVVVSIGESRKKNRESREQQEQPAREKMASVPTKTVPAPVAAKADDPMDHTELVAVITAAVMAASVASGGSDKLIVRSIKKAKR